MGKKNQGRMAQEANEAMQVQDTKVPESRFQSKQQIPEVSLAEDTKTDGSSFDKKKVTGKGAVVKQEVASAVVTAGVGGSVPDTISGAKTLSYSGDEGTVLGSAAYTPVVGQSRSESRIGKKLDATAKQINFVASEQVVQTFDESKPLAEARDKVQGYDGSYRNENARAQKISGGVPGTLLFQRSLDEIKRDQLYFSMGQVVKTNGVDMMDTPTMSVTKSDKGVFTYPQSANYSIPRGNYLHRNLKFKFNSAGKLERFYFDIDDITSSARSTITNKAAANILIDANAAEMDRQIMDSKAGDEKIDPWTPLARAVKEPTQTVGYLRDIEAITGSEVFMAYKKTAACHSYQLNRAAKDGMKTSAPMVEAACGLVMPEISSADTPTGDFDVFSATAFTDGGTTIAAASHMIAAFDSTTKYRTKADLLTMPRSFKMFLQTADNNMNPLRIKREFVAAVNNREVFSTIDRGYDPLMPVCISDRAAIIHPYSFNQLYSWFELEDGMRIYTQNPFRYMYADLRNNYVVETAIPLLSGIAAYLEANSAAFMKVFNTNEVIVPMVHSTCFFSFWSLLVLAATPFILNERINSLRDVLYYEKNVEYPFHQLSSIKECNPMNAVNYSNSDYQQPLITRQMVPSVALTWLMPELFWGFDEKAADDAFSYVLPWYFNQEEFTFGKQSVIDPDDPDGEDEITINSAVYDGYKCAMTMPSIRSGTRLSSLDCLYSMDERDIRLSLDRLVDVPIGESGSGYAGVYKYDQTSDGIPFVTYTKDQLSVGNFLKLPREQGYFIVAPAGLLSCSKGSEYGITKGGKKFGYRVGIDDGYFGETSYMLKFWHGYNAPSIDASGDDQNILAAVDININRASAYKQNWDAYHATIAESNDDVKDYGWVPSLSHMFNPGSTNFIFGRSSFIPFTNGIIEDGVEKVYDDKDVYRVVSLQKALWTRIQMLPMALSPFDFVTMSRGGGEDAIKIDPFDFLYYFGLAGFRASDYREDVYNRESMVANMGFLFLKDPFITDSPVFKEAYMNTQIDTSNSLV